MQRGVQSNTGDCSKDNRRSYVDRRVSKQPFSRINIIQNRQSPKQQSNPANDPSKQKDDKYVVHKHTVPGTSGTVEVIVKTQADAKDSGRSRSSSQESRRRLPWNDAADKQPRRTESASFSVCDPLRTVQFIAEELSGKIDEIGDRNIKQLISNMQLALKRIPTEVSSISREDLSLIRQEIRDALKKDISEFEIGRSELNIAPKKDHKLTQTPSSTKHEAETMQKTFETSLAKLESTCRNLEQTCQLLRKEKEELQRLLDIERAGRDELRRLSEQQQLLDKKLIAEFEETREERDALRVQTTQLQQRLGTNVSQMARDSKRILTELSDKNLSLIHDVTDARADLMSTTLEKDKLAALVATKDAQLERMRAEVDAIQSLVYRQLAEIERERRKQRQQTQIGTSRSGSTDINSVPGTQLLSSISAATSATMKDATADVEDLFNSLMQEKGSREETSSRQVYDQFKISASKAMRGDEQKDFYRHEAERRQFAEDGSIEKKNH